MMINATKEINTGKGARVKELLFPIGWPGKAPPKSWYLSRDTERSEGGS